MNAARILPLLGGCLLLLLVRGLPAQDRETKVRNDRQELADDEHWIYNDLPAAQAEAKKTGKPMLVVFRCIPCEACSEFDEQVVAREPRVRSLMDQFVCLRIVQANGMDLSRFQFDYDQSFSSFLMHPDGAIYGRFGTRSASKDESQDMTMEGFAEALGGALELHKQYPTNKAQLAGKHGSPSTVKVPEDYPSLRGKYRATLDYKGNVVKSCIHCHQVRDAARQVYRSAGKPMPDELLYPYPLPTVVGLQLDARHKAKVLEVAADSAAEKAGFRAGDEIASLRGQPLLSIADVQWVLHEANESDEIPAVVRRGDREVNLTLALDSGWRRKSDISWRVTTWPLRRMATGGLVLESIPEDDLREQSLSADRLALRVRSVGMYGPHAAAKRAGFLRGDIIVEVEGSTEPMRETDFLAYIVNNKKVGQKLSVTVLRKGRRQEMSLPMQP